MSAHPYAAALLLTLSLPVQALRAGDLMLTSFNADNDGWSVVALVELSPHTTVYFTDNRWEGAASLFVGSESHHRWDSGPLLVTAGTVVNFSQIDDARWLSASTGTFTRERVPGSSTYGLSQTEETLYAYQGSSATVPTQFITALSTGAYSARAGGLDGTGLTVGVNATALSLGTDYAEYAGPRTGFEAAQFVALAAQPRQWQDLGDLSLAAQTPRLTAFAVTPVPEPGALSLAAAGAALLTLWRRRRLRWRPLTRTPRAHAWCTTWVRALRTGAAHLRWVQRRVLLGLMALGATSAHAADQVTQAMELGPLVAPITMTIGDAFNDLDPFLPGLQLLRSGTALTLNAGDTFVDQYRFSVDLVEFSAIASTIDLAQVFNVNALQVHLFGPDALQLSAIGAGQGITGRAPTATAMGTDELQTLQPLALQAGTYVMEVRGRVAGLAGGSYAGVINLSPVPEGSAWSMALVGLGVLALAKRHRGVGPSMPKRSIRITDRR